MNGEILDIKEYHRENKISFVIKASHIGRMQKEDIEKKFKLTSTISCNNFVLFDESMRLRKF